MIKGFDKEQHTTPWMKLFGRCVLWLGGWTLVGEKPSHPKYIMIVAPHTSNWDALMLCSALAVLDMKVYWTIKKEWMFWPLGPLIRALGGLPIDRSGPRNFVDQIVEAFQNSKYLGVVIIPEGTRSYRPYWKSGFYYTALRADVPLVLAFGDYASRVCGIGPSMYLTGDVDEDLQKIRDYLKDKRGLHPENEAPIQFRPPENTGPQEQSVESNAGE